MNSPSPEDTATTQEKEKTSMFSLPRLGSSSMRKSSTSTNNRSATPTGSPGGPGGLTSAGGGDLSPKQEKTKSVRERDSTILRKRTLSSGANGSSTGAAGGSAGRDDGDVTMDPSGLIKPGQSILDQIGEADHVGWMRKRGERYNSWKNRYFVLKGPHMYCLRGDSTAVRLFPSTPLHITTHPFRVLLMMMTGILLIGNKDQGIRSYSRI